MSILFLLFVMALGSVGIEVILGLYPLFSDTYNIMLFPTDLPTSSSAVSTHPHPSIVL